MKEISFVINENGCHICISHYFGNRHYPSFQRNHKRQLISHYLWEKANGSIPEGLEICHKCDTPACINTEHFFLGTHLENIKDCNEKGRAKGGSSKGERNPSHKLTEEKVLQIRKESGTLMEIAEKYGISFSTVGYIKNKKTWKYL